MFIDVLGFNQEVGNAEWRYARVDDCGERKKAARNVKIPRTTAENSYQSIGNFRNPCLKTADSHGEN